MTRKKLTDREKIEAAELKKYKASERRKLKRRIEQAERVKAGSESYTEKKKRLKIEAEAKIRRTMETERKKAALLASNDVTSKTMLGIPEAANIKKMGKLSLAAIERIAQLNFDPLEQSVKIAQGKLLKEDHPFLPDFRLTMQEWEDSLEAFDDIGYEDVERFKKQGIKALTNSLTPADLRSKHTLELMQYIYPKRKSMEVSIESARPEMVVKDLTEEEIKLFKSKFKDRY